MRTHCNSNNRKERMKTMVVAVWIMVVVTWVALNRKNQERIRIENMIRYEQLKRDAQALEIIRTMDMVEADKAEGRDNLFRAGVLYQGKVYVTRFPPVQKKANAQLTGSKQPEKGPA
jgi:hypothetical protein